MLLSTFHFRNAQKNPEIAALFKTITQDCRLNPCCLALLEANGLIRLGLSTPQETPAEETKPTGGLDAFTGFKQLPRETT